jgi:7,8-dihydropterin-6-yl-methyl-4-(beta-D-ribofuranosyl)aminobenzene 5'-phosphate synthase
MEGDERRGEGPVLEKDEPTTYRKLAHREDPFGLLQARSSRSQLLHSEKE